MIDGNKLIEAIQGLMQPTMPTPVATGNKEDHIIFVLDSSGSMSTIASDIIGMVNTAYDEARKMAQEGRTIYVSLIVFGEQLDKANVKFSHRFVDALEDLTSMNYRPSANTPMYDGIGLALTTAEQYDVADGVDRSFLVSIFTDGLENASREWRGPAISEKIKKLTEKRNWTITVAGANINVNALADKLSINLGNVTSYQATTKGVGILRGQTVNSMASYSAARSAGATAVANFYAGNAAPVPTPTVDNAGKVCPRALGRTLRQMFDEAQQEEDAKKATPPAQQKGNTLSSI